MTVSSPLLAWHFLNVDCKTHAAESAAWAAAESAAKIAQNVKFEYLVRALPTFKDLP